MGGEQGSAGVGWGVVASLLGFYISCATVQWIDWGNRMFRKTGSYELLMLLQCGYNSTPVVVLSLLLPAGNIIPRHTFPALLVVVYCCGKTIRLGRSAFVLNVTTLKTSG